MFRSLLASLVLAVPATAQLDCEDVEPLPLDLFFGGASRATPFAAGRAVLEGDLAVLSSPDEPVGSAGDRGALYVHRRVAGGWIVEQRLDLFDALAPDTGATAFADRWAAAGDYVFARYRDGSLAGSPARIAVFGEDQGVWSKVQTLDADPSFFVAGEFGTLLAAEDEQLVVGSLDTQAFQGYAPGALESFELSPAGDWERVDLTTGVNLDTGAAHRVDVDGDRLAALSGASLYLLERIPTGWRVEQTLDVASLTSPAGSQEGESVALAGERLVLGGVIDAMAYVFELDAGASMPVLQTIFVDDFPARSMGSPTSALVAAEGDFLVVATEEDTPGQPTIRAFEWTGDAYRAFDILRAGGGTTAVAIEGGRALVAAPWATTSNGARVDERLEVRRLDGARAVPFCFDGGTLLVTGSGAAPFDAAGIHGYDLPAAAAAIVLAGPDVGTALFLGATLCIDPAGGLARVGAPVLSDATGSFVVPTSTVDLSPLAAWLVPGGAFTLQAIYRDGGGLRATNALRVTLCP